MPPQVHLQTQQEVKLRMTGMALQVVRSDGILALYNGLSASLCRQVGTPGVQAASSPSRGVCGASDARVGVGLDRRLPLTGVGGSWGGRVRCHPRFVGRLRAH